MKTEDIKRMAKILQDMEEAKLKGGQHKLDVDGDGDIEADDLADLRKGKKSKVKKDEPMKESVEQIEAELQDTVDKTIDRVANNVNNMREALKNVWLEASIPNLPEKGGETPDATMKHVKKSTHANVQNIDNLDKQLERSKGEKDFVKAHEVDVIDGDKIEGETIDKAKDATKPAPGRKNDQKTGDKAIINKPEDVTAKGLGGKDIKGAGGN
jgi:hypothetical protein